MNDRKSMRAIAVMTGLALIASSGARADTASDQADVALRQAKFDLLKSQIPAPPDKSLTPSVPAAPSLTASTDRNVYRLAQAVAEDIATSVADDVVDPTGDLQIVLDDGRARAAVGAYKSVATALEVMRRNLDARRDVLTRTVASLPVSMPSAAKKGGAYKEKAVPIIAAVTVVAGVVQAVVGFAELMKPQYGVGSTSQQPVTDGALSAAVTEALTMRKSVRVIDFGASVNPCVDAGGFSVGVGSLACDPASPQLLAALKTAFFVAICTARDAISAADNKRYQKLEDGTKKDLAEKRTALQATIDDSLKAWAALNTVDAAGGVSNLDAAERIEPLLLRMTAKAKDGSRARGIAFLSVQTIAADSDVVVDTRWYAPLKVGLESVVIARWRLTDADGKVVKQQLLCRQTDRAPIPLRDGATGVPTIGRCTDATATARSDG